MTNNQIRVALYGRVSTNGKGQDTELQLSELRSVAAQRGWTIVGEYVDQGVSGAKEKRPALDRLMKDAYAGKIDSVIVWKFDRFARSTTHLLKSLETFNALNIGFVSLREQIDTDTPLGKMLFTLVSALSEFERDLIRERVRAGVQRAKDKGKTLGRPTDVVIDIAKAQALLESGKSKKAIAEMLGVPRTSLIRALKAGDQNLSKTA